MKNEEDTDARKKKCRKFLEVLYTTSKTDVWKVDNIFCQCVPGAYDEKM